MNPLKEIKTVSANLSDVLAAILTHLQTQTETQKKILEILEKKGGYIIEEIKNVPADEL